MVVSLRFKIVKSRNKVCCCVDEALAVRKTTWAVIWLTSTDSRLEFADRSHRSWRRVFEPVRAFSSSSTYISSFFLPSSFSDYIKHVGGYHPLLCTLYAVVVAGENDRRTIRLLTPKPLDKVKV